MVILEISYKAAVLITAVVVIRALALHKLPKFTFLALWGAALCQLLIPYTMPSQFSIYTSLNRLTGGLPQRLTETAISGGKILFPTPDPVSVPAPPGTFPGEVPAIYLDPGTILTERKGRIPQLCSSFSRNSIEERIVSIMNLKKASLWGKLLALGLVVATVIVFASSSALVEGNKPPGKNSADRKITMQAIHGAYPVSTDKVMVTIRNNTSADSNANMYYDVEFKNGREWVKIPLDFPALDVDIILSPQQVKNFDIYLFPDQHDYQPGNYRVVKSVIDNEGKIHYLSAEFTLN